MDIAAGLWVWTTAPISGRRWYRIVWSGSSEVGAWLPSTTVPSNRTTGTSSKSIES